MASSLPPGGRYTRPGEYLIEVAGVPVAKFKNWSTDLDADIVWAAKQVYQQDLRPVDIFFSRILRPFAQCLVDGEPLDPDHPLGPWVRQHTAQFQQLRSLCRAVLEDEPGCFSSELSRRILWPEVRSRLIQQFDPFRLSPRFDALLDQVEAVLLWWSNLTILVEEWRPPKQQRQREDPRKYCIQPDQMVVDAGPDETGGDTRPSTVPEIPLDFDDEEDD